MSYDLSFTELRRINKQRCLEGFKHTLESWSIAEWTNAMAGEGGEAAEAMLQLMSAIGRACNTSKKMIRHRDNVAGNKGDDKDLVALRLKLGRELADVIIYADLVATSQGMDLGELVRDTFNAKSIELGAPHRL